MGAISQRPSLRDLACGAAGAGRMATRGDDTDGAGHPGQHGQHAAPPAAHTPDRGAPAHAPTPPWRRQSKKVRLMAPAATFCRLQVAALQEGREGAPSAAGKGAPIPVSAPTSTFHLTVVPANIATSIPYRQYCFAYHSGGAGCVPKAFCGRAQSGRSREIDDDG